jgi:acyl carrier protein
MNMLTEKEITETQDIIIEQLGVRRDQLTLEARLIEDLGSDSLYNVEISMGIEDHFGVSLPDEALERVHTVGDVYALLETSFGRISK